MSPYKVLVVDDSAFMRKVISDLISEDPQFTVVSVAKNGREAVEKVKQLQPDVITMDVEMPEMNGIEAVRKIMAENPTPIVMLSSLTEEGAKETIVSLELGAIDFIRKPSGSISLDLYNVQRMLLEKLTVAVRVKVKRSLDKFPSPINLRTKKEEESNNLSNLSTQPNRLEHLVAIGTSTGGPRALQQVISQIPSSFPAPILIVQHMPPNFTKSLAQRLDSFSHIQVVEAEDKCKVLNGVAYIAPGGWHMKLVKEAAEYRLRLTDEEPRCGHRPSVDTLYESLLPFKELKKHIVLMTGMGSDGANGMKALKEAGAESTIAEAEQTCIVYGMPRVAVELNSVDYVLPLHEISHKLINLVCN